MRWLNEFAPCPTRCWKRREGALYPTLQKLLLEGWVTAEAGLSETNRRVRFCTLTKEGAKQLKREIAEYELATAFYGRRNAKAVEADAL
jgi:DNA-binding PadR family transcriptional regulator